jgi:hypothetical protein
MLETPLPRPCGQRISHYLTSALDRYALSSLISSSVPAESTREQFDPSRTEILPWSNRKSPALEEILLTSKPDSAWPEAYPRLAPRRCPDRCPVEFPARPCLGFHRFLR